MKLDEQALAMAGIAPSSVAADAIRRYLEALSAEGRSPEAQEARLGGEERADG